MSDIGVIIDRRMAELGLKQAAFADLCGLSESQISLLRSGGRGSDMRVDTAMKLARGLGVTVDELLSPTQSADIPKKGYGKGTKTRAVAGRGVARKRTATT